MRLLTVLSLLLAFAVGSAARAADISAHLDRAAAAAAAGDHGAALAALDAAVEAVRKEAPLALEPFLLVSRPAKTYGDYAPRANAEFGPNEELLFYMEPKNLVYGRGANGAFEPAFEVDLEILAMDGSVVAGKEKFGSFRFTSLSRVQDIFLNLNVSLTGAPPGDYKIRFTVRDLNSKKLARAEQTITIKG